MSLPHFLPGVAEQDILKSLCFQQTGLCLPSLTDTGRLLAGGKGLQRQTTGKAKGHS